MTTPARPTETAEIREALALALQQRLPLDEELAADAAGWIVKTVLPKMLAHRDTALDREIKRLQRMLDATEKARVYWAELADKRYKEIFETGLRCGDLYKRASTAEAERDAALTQAAQLTTDLAAAGVRIAALEGALKPFCFGDPTLENILFGDMPDEATCTFTIKLGDTRRARAVLSNGER